MHRSITVRTQRFFAAATLLGLLVPFATHAELSITPAFTATQTVANVTVANTQTLATSSSVANVAEVKASKTLTVGTAPTNNNTVTVENCVVTFATTTAGVGPSSRTSDDLNCLGGAIILTATTTNDIALTPTQIANELKALTNATSTAHGTLAVSASTTSATSVVFTTSGTETSATNISFTDGTSGKVTAPASAIVTGVVPVAQVWLATPANVDYGDTFTAVINGTTVSYTATSSTVANVTLGLTTAINASAVASAVTAADNSTNLSITSDTAGTAFTATVSASNGSNVAQTVVFTPTDLGTNDVLSLTINSSTYTHTVRADESLQQIVEDLNSQTSGNAAVSCTEDDASITCVAASAGTSFTYSASVSDQPGSANNRRGGGGGGGGSSHSNSNVTANHGTVTASPSASGQAHASANASFNRDLTAGASGSDVTALQKYLNAHGYVLAATGPGSAGNETSLFGALTRAALAKLQAAAGITPAAGYFGPKTRAYISAHP